MQAGKRSSSVLASGLGEFPDVVPCASGRAGEGGDSESDPRWDMELSLLAGLHWCAGRDLFSSVIFAQWKVAPTVAQIPANLSKCVNTHESAGLPFHHK